MNPRHAAIALAASLLAVPTAEAHPDYEHTQVVEGADGRQWRLVLHYSDGIIRGDPVSLIVRDASGGTVAETDIGRQICIWGCRIGDCLVFRHDLGRSPFPANVWRFESGRLEPRDTAGMQVLGAFVPLLNDPIGYAFWLCFFFAPIVLHVQARRLRNATVRICARTALWIGAAPCLVLWLWMTLVSQISPVLLFGLVAVVGGAWSVWRARHGRMEVPSTT
jgi:hypothetical protein